MVSELLSMNGLGRLVGQLQAGDPALTQSLLRVVCYVASHGPAMTEIYQTGTIPVLLSVVAGAVRDANACNGLPMARVTDMQLVRAPAFLACLVLEPSHQLVQPQFFDQGLISHV